MECPGLVFHSQEGKFRTSGTGAAELNPPFRRNNLLKGVFIQQIKHQMKRITFILLLAGVCCSMGARANHPLWFYVGTFTSEGAEGISLCSLDTVTGNLEEVRLFKGIDNPNFVRLSPDRKYLYATTRGPLAADPDGGSVTAFRVRDNGELQFINKRSSHGDDPCYADVSADGRWVAVANYGGGSVALYPVADDGSLEPASSVVRHEGSGPLKRRQSRPYAHSIRFMGGSDQLMAADLGADKLFAYSLDPSSGKLISRPGASTSLPPGSGPRHFDFTPDGQFIYVVNELSSTITVFENKEGSLVQLQDVTTLPGGYSGVSYCADIHLSPCRKFLYASNRGHNSVVVFSRDAASGMISPVTHVAVEGNWPRNFAMAPGGRFMLVANQRSHNITLFRMEGGLPVFTGKSLETKAPVCIEFL